MEKNQQNQPQQPFLTNANSSIASSSGSTVNQIQTKNPTPQQNKHELPFSILSGKEHFDLPVQPPVETIQKEHREDLRSSPTAQQLRKLTSEKRKAQNRAAQRNFRERKEKQCKRNEENLIIRTEENKAMRELVKSLEAENAFLRQHVSESVIEQVVKQFPVRRQLSSVVGPISAYDEFLGPDKPLSESEEHTQAATALSSLASGPIDSIFDPQLQDLAVSNHSIPLTNSTHDLIVPDDSNSFDNQLHLINKPTSYPSCSPRPKSPPNFTHPNNCS